MCGVQEQHGCRDVWLKVCNKSIVYTHIHTFTRQHAEKKDHMVLKGLQRHHMITHRHANSLKNPPFFARLLFTKRPRVLRYGPTPCSMTS